MKIPKNNSNNSVNLPILKSLIISLNIVLLTSCRTPALVQVTTSETITPDGNSTTTPTHPSPTHTESITIPPTVIETIPPSITPYPTATPLNSLFDGFNDACISIYQWYPQHLANNSPVPTAIVKDNCFDFSFPDTVRHLVETNTHLVLDLTNGAKGGLISYWPNCEIREVQLVVSDYSYQGISSSWLGLAVPHPQGDQPPISIWVSSRETYGNPSTKVIITRKWIGSTEKML